jgi:hypothetical protein
MSLTLHKSKRIRSDSLPERQPCDTAKKRKMSSILSAASSDQMPTCRGCSRKSPRLVNRPPSSCKGPSPLNSFSSSQVATESLVIKRRRRYLALKVAPVASLTSTVASTSSEKIFMTSQIQQLRKIQDAKIQLVVWRRHSMPTFMASLADPHLPAYVLPSVKCTIAPDELAQILKSKTVKLAKAIGQDRANEMIRDVCLLTKEFATATKIHKVAVKLEHFGDNGCQYWHQDSVPFRLVATYRGPCTEWVHPSHGDATLRRRQENSRHKQTFAHNDVPLFKGRGVSDSNDNTLLRHPGIVHRSPRIEGSRIHRLVLVLDLPDKCC